MRSRTTYPTRSRIRVIEVDMSETDVRAAPHAARGSRQTAHAAATSPYTDRFPHVPVATSAHSIASHLHRHPRTASHSDDARSAKMITSSEWRWCGTPGSAPDRASACTSRLRPHLARRSPRMQSLPLRAEASRIRRWRAPRAAAHPREAAARMPARASLRGRL